MKHKSPDKLGIDHINSLLKNIFPNVNDKGIEYTLDSQLVYHELLHSIKPWSDRVLNKSLVNLKTKEQEYTYENLIKECKSVQDYLLRKPKNTFRFIIPVNYPLLDNFKLNSVSIRKITDENEYNEIVTGIKSSLRYQISKPSLEFLTDKDIYFLEFVVTEEVMYLGYEKFYSVFLLLKGILEFSYSWGYWSLNLFGKYKRYICSMSHPLFVYVEGVDSDGKDSKNISMYEDVHDKIKEIRPDKDNKRRDLSLKLLGVFSDSTDSYIQELLLSCLKLYTLGSDTPYTERSFLYFWNVLEKFTLTDSGNTKEVLKRSLKHVEGDLHEFPNLVSNISDIRNDLVHKGERRITDIDVGVVKSLSEYGINFLINNLDYLKTVDHLQQYYIMKGKDTEDLEEMKKVIDLVLTKTGQKST